MNTIIFFFYNILIYPLMLGVLRIASLFNPKIKTGFELRKSINGIAPWMNLNIKNPIWIHCASGEFEYAKALIREIKSISPSEKILITYFSPSYLKQIQNFPLIDAHSPLPWDFPTEMNEFIDKIKPKKILIARTDLWPQMLRTARDKKVKTILYSALLSTKSSKVTNPLVRFFYSWTLSLVDEIFCVSQNDKDAFDKITNPNKVIVTGDTRFDQVLHRLQNQKELKNIFNINEKVLVCGSMWPQDESAIFKAFPKLLKNNIRIVIAPHEPTPEHLLTMENSLKSLSLSSTRYSTTTTWNFSDILIIDQIGILAELYTQADFAFIGGSFKKQIHSVMEAIAAGCYTFFGPKYVNNREAIDFQTKLTSLNVPIAKSINNFIELENAILSLAHKDYKQDKYFIIEEVKKLSGASNNIASKLL